MDMSRKDVKCVVGKLKNDRATGVDDIKLDEASLQVNKRFV